MVVVLNRLLELHKDVVTRQASVMEKQFTEYHCTARGMDNKW